jgi:hypothetical protein
MGKQGLVADEMRQCPQKLNVLEGRVQQQYFCVGLFQIGCTTLSPRVGERAAHFAANTDVIILLNKNYL